MTQLTTDLKKYRINWGEYEFYGASYLPIPVLGKEYIPTICSAIADTEILLKPMRENTPELNQFSMLLLTMDVTLRASGDIGAKGAKLRDMMFEKILGEYPYDLVEWAVYEYTKNNTFFPAPAQLKEFLENKHFSRKHKLANLKKLLDKAQNPPPATPEITITPEQEAENKNKLAEMLTDIIGSFKQETLSAEEEERQHELAKQRTFQEMAEAGMVGE